LELFMARNSVENPWIPGPDLPWRRLLVSPDGTRHLAFDKGQWLRVYADRTTERLSVGQTMALRPSDIDTIIKWTVLWCMAEGIGTNRANELIDDLANGARTLVVYLASERS
jgi:hypothetical protein